MEAYVKVLVSRRHFVAIGHKEQMAMGCEVMVARSDNYTEATPPLCNPTIRDSFAVSTDRRSLATSEWV